MTAIASEPSWKSRSMRVCAVLLILLIPLTAGALWIAQHGSHGATSFCIIEHDAKFATFIYESYSANTFEFRCRSFDLQTGKQVSRERIIRGIICMGNTFAIAARDSDGFSLFQWDTVPFLSEPRTFHVSSSSGKRVRIQSFINGFVLACEYKTDSARILLIDPTTSTVLDEAEVSSSVEFHPWRDTNYVELIRGATPNQVSRMIRIVDGKLAIDSERSKIEYVSPKDEFGDSYFFNRSSDGKSIEVRFAESNELRTSIELSQSLLRTNTINYLSGDSWISLGPQWGIPVKNLEFLSGRELPVPTGWILSARGRTSKIMLVTTPGASLGAAPGKAQAKLIDEASGTVIADIESGRVIGSRFIADGEQLIIANVDQQIMHIDTRTGKVLKVFSPYWYIPYLEILPAVAFFCWACAWLWFSSVGQRHAWIDCAIITGLFVAYIILRTRMTGFPGDVVRPIYQLAEGIFASWLILSSLWLVLGRTRLSLRILPMIGILGLIIFIALLCMGSQNPRIWELIIAGGLLCVWLVVAYIPLRFMGYGFLFIEQEVKGESPASLAKGAIPIRDLFLLTTVLAFIFALGRFAPPGLQLSLRMVIDLLVLVFGITLTGLAAARVGLSRKSFAGRVLTLLVVAAFGMSLPFVWMAVNFGWKRITDPDMTFLFWNLRLHTSTAVATAMCLYAYRLRGWRLTRKANLRLL